MGVDLDSPDFKDTPKRFAKAMMSFKVKDKKEMPKITTFEHKGNDTLVMVKNLQVRSLCGHHLFPFFGIASVGYIPSNKKAGLSKFQRVLDFVASEPQDQEGLTERYLNLLVEEIDPKFIAVKLTCQHTCMSVRGAKVHDAETITFLSSGNTPTDLEMLQLQNF